MRISRCVVLNYRAITKRDEVREKMLAVALLVVCVIAQGCSESFSPTSPVRGIVTVHGTPLSQGLIVFFPENGRPATSPIHSDGTYALTTFKKDDGALPGKHVVAIQDFYVSAAPTTQPTFADEQASRLSSPSNKLLPANYARRETSPLRAEVKSSVNEINFELPAE
jgi:hypothetical protein